MTIREHVAMLRAERIEARPYDRLRQRPAVLAVRGEARVSALLALALELREIEADLIREALEVARSRE